MLQQQGIVRGKKSQDTQKINISKERTATNDFFNN